MSCLSKLNQSDRMQHDGGVQAFILSQTPLKHLPCARHFAKPGSTHIPQSRFLPREAHKLIW